MSRLNLRESYPCLLIQKVCNYPSDCVESYLMAWHWIDGDDRQILVLGLGLHRHHTTHDSLPLDFNWSQPIRHEHY